MKKPILILAIVLCSTMLYAQTLTPRATGERKVSTKAMSNQTEKSRSIFTKDATPLKYVDFSAENVGYSTGIKTGGLDGHGENYDFAVWHRWPNADSATFLQAANIYPALAQNYFGNIGNFCSYLMNYADTATSSAENGFMMMSLYDQRTRNSGNFNAYIRIDSINASNASIIDVQLFQYYRKYYDRCYIDYSTDGQNWTEMEINLSGIDISISSTLWGFCTYTLPLAAANQSNLSIRIRYYSLNSSTRNAYGYFWMIDDVSIIPGETDRLRKYDQEFVEGGYGLIPQGLEINPAWYTNVLNTGANTQNNVEAKIFHLNASQDNATLVESYNNCIL